jgi:RNA polymerase sigma-70 factor (ECF subfamily)
VQRAVVDAVLALPEPCRVAVLLRFFDELPPREIAERVGAPVETVRTRIKRGIELLRTRLAGQLGAIAGLSASGGVGGAAATLGRAQRRERA